MLTQRRFQPTSQWLTERGWKRRTFKDDYFLRLPNQETILYLSLMHEHISADFIGLFKWDGYHYEFFKQGTVTGITELEYEQQLQECQL